MYVIITCKYEKDPIKNNRENVTTPFFKLYHYLLPWKPLIGSGQISNSSKLLYMSSLPASIKKDQMKNSGENVMMSMGFFQTLNCSQLRSPWWISLYFELTQALMYIITTCMYEMNPIKNVRENVMTPFFPL